MMIPIRTLAGAPYQPNAQEVACTTANAIYIGDAVKLAGTGTVAGVIEVDISADGGADIWGIVVGVVPTSYDSDPYKTTATTERTLLVETDLDLVYAVAEDAVGGAIDQETALGSVVDLISNGSGNNVTGLSSNKLDSNTVATGSSAKLRIIGLSQDIKNSAGAAGSVYEVVINEAQAQRGNAGNGI